MKKKIEKHLVTIEFRANDILSSEYLGEVIQNALDDIGYRAIVVHCEPAVEEEPKNYRVSFKDIEETDFQKGFDLAREQYGWHSVDDKLPPIDQEVIVLTDMLNEKKLDSPRRICFGHRPDPNGWDGKDLATGEVHHYDPVLYNGWNVPGVKYWMFYQKVK